ncbi:hypothetical protein WJX81_008555 [Elliptochloris bilobata]|uniref:Exocyst complex component Sec8 n=1 Tax=Elliptochloris bilobata TaxID=381761 RepID=A0AAW1RVU8_9CHLO
MAEPSGSVGFGRGQPVGQAVDWDAVDEELYHMAPEFMDPRFDSLHHVLSILGAVDSDAALDELRAQRERVDVLVDQVVQDYHAGFNKSIHNYSQILVLFTQAKEQVETLRAGLEEARRRLGLEPRSLQQQWRRSVMLGDTVRLLQDAKSVIDAPQRVQRLELAKDWEAAVALLIGACNKLARHELSKVGALRDIKRDMAERRATLQKLIVHEVESRIFNIAEPAAEGAAAAAGAVSAPNAHLRCAVGAGKELAAQEAAMASEASTGSLPGGAQSGLASGRAGSEPAEAPAAAGSISLEHLVVCLASLGGIAEAQLTLRRHMPAQIRNVILRALAASTEKMASGGHASIAGGGTQANAARLAQHTAARVFKECLQVLRSLVGALRMLASSRAPPNSAGIELLLAARGDSEGNGALPANLATPSNQYVRREACAAWGCMQAECKRLLAELLHAPALHTQSFKALQTNLQTQSGWLRGSDTANGGQRNASGLSFSFDVQVAGQAAQAVLDRNQSLAVMALPDKQSIAQQALGGQAGGTYLAPALYKPVLQFVEGANKALAAAEGDAGGARQGGEQEQARAAANRALLDYLEAFVSDEFLPEVYVDFRGRATDMLAKPDAFKARARARAAYTSDVASGRPVVAAARETEAMVAELLRWAAQMPPFAPEITGVVENILGRVLDAFQVRSATLLGGAAARALAEAPNLAALMAREPAAPLAGDVLAFFCGRPGDPADAWVASAAGGFGQGGEAVQFEVVAKVSQERPVRADTLLGSSERAAALAALSDSAEYIADVILRAAGRGRASAALAAKDAGGAGDGDGDGGAGRRRAPRELLTEGLKHLMDRYRAAAGLALRALRLDQHLGVVQQLQALPEGHWVCDEEAAAEVDESVGALSRSAARADEDLAPFLAPPRRSYVFGGLAAAAARFIMWLLPELQELNQHGVTRMCRLLAVLQPSLSALGAPGGAFRPEAARAFDKARAYYGLLALPAAGLLRVAAERPGRFFPAEYQALLQVKYEEREVTAEQRAELARIIAAGGNAGARRSRAPQGPVGGPVVGNRAAAPEARLLAMAQRGSDEAAPQQTASASATPEGSPRGERG